MTTREELATALEQQKQVVQESMLTTRVTNALLLAQAMGVDITQPLEAQKVCRHLASVERQVGREVG